MPTPEIVKGEQIEKTIQEQPNEKEESTLIDEDKKCTTENEQEHTTKVQEIYFSYLDIGEEMYLICTMTGVPEQEAPSVMPRQTIVEGGTVEKTIQEQTSEKADSMLIDEAKSCIQENEHEQATKVVEVRE
ncbi:hypothetical protein RIF29_26941 [Crotalaria pallida]|uniref:Uncharacterized protein n=1 Tax=Crotalaria pallida TaxID=3830 RepID=A0AAN9EN85_CROPI